MGTETTKYRIVLDDKLSPQLRKALKQANAFDNSVKRIGKSAKRTGSSLRGAFGRFALGAGIALAARQILKLGINMEQTRVAFETFTGSAELGNKLIKELVGFSNVTPFETTKVLSAGQTLLGFGLKTEKILVTLKLLGDISAGTGKDLKELAVIYGQVRGAGRLMGQDALQLINAGFNPLQQISEKTGRSMLDLKKDMEAGLISFAMVEQAFKEATSAGGRFFKLTEKQSKTFGGRISTLVGKIQLLGASIGEEWSDSFASMTVSAINFVDEVTPKLIAAAINIETSFRNLGTSIEKAFDNLGKGKMPKFEILNALSFALNTVINKITQTVDNFKAIGLVVKGVFQGLNRDFDGQDLSFKRAGNVLSESRRQFDERQIQNFLLSGFGGEAGIKAANIEIKNQLNKLGKALDPNIFTGGSIPGLSSGLSFDQQGNPIDAATGKPPVGAGGGGKGGSAVSGVQSRVRNITINIENMVKDITFNNITGGQSEAQLVEAVKRALLTAVSDVNVISR